MIRFRTAFTLIEIMLAIALAVIIMSLAIPVLGSMLSENELEATYKRFDEFVQKARSKAVKERRTYLLIWHEADAKREGGITLEPEILTSEEAEAEPEGFAFGEAEVLLQRPFALEDKPATEWPFWKSGTCEPVRVAYKGKAGSWLAEFDPMTTRGTILEMKER